MGASTGGVVTFRLGLSQIRRVEWSSPGSTMSGRTVGRYFRPKTMAAIDG
jgi:hypothetical protein